MIARSVLARAGWALLLSLVSAGLVCGPLFWGQGCYQGNATDLPLQHIPIRTWMGECLRSGQIPWWNPYMFTGYPSWVFRPPWAQGLIFWALCPDPAWALRWEIFTHLVWFHLGLQCWLWHRGHGLIASCLGAHVVTFSGFTLLHLYAGHVDVLDSLVWTGWTFCGFEAFLARGTAVTLVGAAVPAALLVANGHFHVAYLVLWCAVLWNLARLLGGEIPLKLGRFLGRVGAIAAATGGLCAFQLLPLALTLGWFNRNKVSPEYLASSTEPPSAWLTWLVPDLFNLQTIPLNWTMSQLWESHASMTIFAPVCLLALAQPSRRRGTLLLLAFAVVLSLGASTPVYWLYRQLDPVLHVFRAPSRFVLPATLVLAALVAEVWEAPQARARRAALLWAALLGLSALVLLMAGPAGLWERFVDFCSQGKALPWLREGRFPDGLVTLWQVTLLRLGLQALLFGLVGLAFAHRFRRPTAAAALLLGLGLVDACRLAWPYWSQSRPLQTLPGAWIARLRADAVPYRGVIDPVMQQMDWGPRYQVYQFDGYEGSLLESWQVAVQAATGSAPNVTSFVHQVFGRQPLYEHQSLRYYLSPRRPEELPAELRGLRLVEVSEGLGIYENAAARPRLTFVERLLSQPPASTYEVLSWLYRQPGYPDRVACWAGEAWNSATTVRGRVENARFAPNWVSAEVTVDADCVLQLNDAYTPGWSVFVSGREQPLLVLNAGMGRGVRLSPGLHRVEFRYAPPRLALGLGLSLATGLTLLALLVRQNAAVLHLKLRVGAKHGQQ